MKRFFFTGFCLLIFSLPGKGFSSELPVLRSQSSVRVSEGKTLETVVLGEDEGKVFIEVPKDMTAKIRGQPHFNFDGFLLAPKITALPEKLPVFRTREVLVFDFKAGNNEQISFSDRFFSIPYKRQLFIENEKARSIRVYVPIKSDPVVRRPELWFYDEKFNDNPHDDEWKSLGGSFQTTADPEIGLFSAVISRTGIYGVFDRNPLPLFGEVTDPAVVELAENSPFPSVQQAQAPSPREEDFEDGVVPVVPSEAPEREEGLVPAVNPLDENSGGISPSSLEEIPAVNPPKDAVPVVEDSKTLEALKNPESQEASGDFLPPIIEEDIKNDPASESPALENKEEIPLPQALPKSGGVGFPLLLAFCGVILTGYLYLREYRAIEREE